MGNSVLIIIYILIIANYFWHLNEFTMVYTVQTNYLINARNFKGTGTGA
jgi:hypothetical protein